MRSIANAVQVPERGSAFPRIDVVGELNNLGLWYEVFVSLPLDAEQPSRFYVEAPYAGRASQHNPIRRYFDDIAVALRGVLATRPCKYEPGNRRG